VATAPLSRSDEPSSALALLTLAAPTFLSDGRPLPPPFDFLISNSRNWLREKAGG
jgi:hypothetical protein